LPDDASLVHVNYPDFAQDFVFGRVQTKTGKTSQFTNESYCVPEE
jgi:hypothetical protein